MGAHSGFSFGGSFGVGFLLAGFDLSGVAFGLCCALNFGSGPLFLGVQTLKFGFDLLVFDVGLTYGFGNFLLGGLLQCLFYVGALASSQIAHLDGLLFDLGDSFFGRFLFSRELFLVLWLLSLTLLPSGFCLSCLFFGGLLAAPLSVWPLVPIWLGLLGIRLLNFFFGRRLGFFGLCFTFLLLLGGCLIGWVLF